MLRQTGTSVMDRVFLVPLAAVVFLVTACDREQSLMDERCAQIVERDDLKGEVVLEPPILGDCAKPVHVQNWPAGDGRANDSDNDSDDRSPSPGGGGSSDPDDDGG